jgi:thiamine kinase-like enzyme
LRWFPTLGGEDYPFHHVGRAHEAMVARAAHQAGFAPELIHSEPGMMVSQFLNARTFDGKMVQDNLVRVAELVKNFHQTMQNHVSGYARLFWVFHLPLVYGHNDLLPANFLEADGRLWLIDFEYAGFSTAMFDLAGLSSNAGFTDEQSAQLLETYFGEIPKAPTLKAFDAMQCASLLREAMWSMVSELYLSAPGVDYQVYTAGQLEAFAGKLSAYQSRYGKIASS